MSPASPPAHVVVSPAPLDVGFLDILPPTQTRSRWWGRILRHRKKAQKNPPQMPHQRLFAKQQIYEGLDYEETESEIEMIDRRKLTRSDHVYIGILRWVVLFVIGTLTLLTLVVGRLSFFLRRTFALLVCVLCVCLVCDA